MRRAALLALLVLPAVVRAEDKLSASDPRGASGWACTAETLAAGARCIFEAADAPAQAGQDGRNVSTATGLAERLCALRLKAGERSKATDAVGARCKEQVAAAAKEACGLGGQPLLDAQGRFTPAARGCYRALTEARQHAEWQASTLAPCCQCLAERHCVAAADRCVQSADQKASVEAANPSCGVAACTEACVGLLPEPHAAR